MNQVRKKPAQEVGQVFKWRDQKGNFHPVTGMETRHLFYTLRMVWNHKMPEVAKLHPYKHYTFSPFYSDDYLKKAIAAIYSELQTRNNLTAQWRFDLRKMQGYFEANISQGSKPQLIGTPHEH